MQPLGLFFLGLLFLFLPKRILAQQEIKITGVLFDYETNNRVALAEITNLRTGFAVGSNDLGIFVIKVKIGDTLEVVKRQFNDYRIVVSSEKDLMIKLNRGAMLNEVVVNGQTKKQALNAIEKDFRSKGSFYAGKPPLALLSPFGGSPLTFFYELFGKTPKNARRFKNIHQQELQQTQVDKFFNQIIINKNTGLAGKQLEDFMINYRPDYVQTTSWNSYDGVKWIMESYKKYTENLKVSYKNNEKQN